MIYFSQFILSFSPSSNCHLFMWSLLTVLVIYVVIFVKRLLYLKSMGLPKDSISFWKKIFQMIQSGENIELIEFCEKNKRIPLPYVRMLKAAMENIRKGEKRIKNCIEEEYLKITCKLKNWQGGLIFMANSTLVLGFLSSMFVFITMSHIADSSGRAHMISKVIVVSSPAIIITAMNPAIFSIILAVLLFCSYAFIKIKEARIIDEIDEYSLRIANAFIEESCKIQKYHIGIQALFNLVHGVSFEIKRRNIKIFIDNKMIKEINT